MKVVVLGAGLMGVTSAYYLAKAGHEVTVVDRQPGAGLETSYANGGQITSGHAAPWASPEAPRQFLESLWKEDAPLLFRLQASPRMWAWALRFLANCTEQRHRRNMLTNFRIAAYSRDQLRLVRADTGIDYDHSTAGILHVFREPELYDKAAARLVDLKTLGAEEALLDRAGCLALEPALETSTASMVGGIHAVDDETGDAYKFTQGLASYCAERLGVEFRYGVTIHHIDRANGRIAGVATDQGQIRGDAFAVCMGSYTPLLLRDFGFPVPIYPVKGYSTTIPVGGANRAPTIGITDESRKAVVTRLGDRLRAAGTAEITGYNLNMRQVRAEALRALTVEWFPEGCEPDQVEYWCGLRPMTPDGPPIVGPTPCPNLFINAGHGTLGWTMACGSGRVLADVISGTAPEISLDGLTVDRFA